MCNNDGRSVFRQGEIIQFVRFYEGRYSEDHSETFRRRNHQVFSRDRILSDGTSTYPLLKRSVSHGDVHTSVRYGNVILTLIAIPG